jgi:hypothetical protein
VAPATSRPSIDDAAILSWLRPLKPLPKVHYSFPISDVVLNPGDPRLFEYVRLTGAATLHGRYSKEREVDAAVEACARANRSKPVTPASLGVFYGPWHSVWPKEEPPTTFGRLHDAELAYMREKLGLMKDMVARCNRRHGANIPISVVLLDSECFEVKENDREWNAAITRKLNDADRLAKTMFPGARVDWYARGVMECQCKDGWDTCKYFTFEEEISNYAARLYTVPEIGQMRETFKRTFELAQSKGVNEVTPWVALGAGYMRNIHPALEFVSPWDYELYYSWQLGAEINHPWYARRPERFAPWDAARIVVFYPKPFCHTVWVRHFVAYVRGANGVRELPP